MTGGVVQLMTDPFEKLGFPRRFRLDAREVEQRHRELSRALHPDRFAQASPAERRAAAEQSAAINDAFRSLRDPQLRAAALLATVGRVADETARAEPDLLQEMLDLREQLEEARVAGAKRDAIVGNLRVGVEAQVSACEGEIAAAFDGEHDGDAAAIDRAYRAMIRLRYLRRFLDDADAMVEE